MREFRPMSVPEILDMTFRLYRERFVTFLLIALIVYLPYSLLTTLTLIGQQPAVSAAPGPGVPTGPGHQPSLGPAYPGAGPQFNVAGFALSMFGVFLFLVIFMPLCTGADAEYFGRIPRQGTVSRRKLPAALLRLSGLIGTQILAGIIVVLGLVLLIVPGIIFSLWFYVLVPVVVLEGVAGTTALGRSRELMRGNLGKAFLVGLLVGLVAAILGAIIGAGIGLVMGLFGASHQIIQVFAQSVSGTLLLPIQIAPFTLLYYDLRIRKEAFDLQMLSSALEQPAT